VVVSALREFKSKPRIPSRLVTAEEAAANLSVLMESARKNSSQGQKKLPSDHGDFYYEFGLPK
jgi:hypothetical protein